MFGISTVTLLGAGISALGAYNTGKFVVDRLQRNKQRVKEARAVYQYVKFAAEHGKKVYDALNTPETRAAELKRLSVKLHGLIDGVDAPVEIPTVPSTSV